MIICFWSVQETKINKNLIILFDIVRIIIVIITFMLNIIFAINKDITILTVVIDEIGKRIIIILMIMKLDKEIETIFAILWKIDL
jgi:hypothetical protein